jgi:hypothetical protein
MHKSGPESGPSKWTKKLHQFFNWLLCEISRKTIANPRNIAGDKYTRRKIARASRSLMTHLGEAYPHAPALQGAIADIMEKMRELSDPSKLSHFTVLEEGPIGKMRVYPDQVRLKQAISVDWDRRARGREKELLYLAWIVARNIDAKNKFDQIKEDLTHTRSCEGRSFDEGLRRFHQNTSQEKLVSIFERHFEEFKVEKPGKTHPDRSYPSIRIENLARITALTHGEMECISKLCYFAASSRWRRANPQARQVRQRC